MADDSSLWQWLSEALSGPGRLRFFIQPAVAILLGIRDGRNDARAGELPYLWGLLFQKESRRKRAMEGLRAAAMPLAVAFVMDSLLQYHTNRTVHPGWALVVGALLVALPYASARALANRVVTRRRRRRAGAPEV